MSIWQSKKWGEMLVKSNQADKIFEINGIFVEKRKVALGEYGLFILGLDRKISIDDEKNLIQLAKDENVMFIQVETLDYYSDKNIKFNVLIEGFYKKFITPYTALIDLTLSLDEILANMKQKGRYNIRLAEKKGIIVKKVEKNLQNIQIYYDLMLETTSRDGFFGNTKEFYEIFLNLIENSEILFAYYEDKVIAGGIFVFDEKVSIYYYGVSTSDNKYRNLMAPYLLQFEAIKIAKEIGSKLYDFLGVAGPEEKNSHLAGVTDFKLKLTPDVRKVSESYIYVNKKIKYCLIGFLKKIKGK